MSNKNLPAPKTAPIIEKFALKYSVDVNQVTTILRNTAFKQSSGREVSHSEMAALLIIADQYNLNPFTKEIYAFFSKKTNAIIPIVGVDGWIRKILEHPQYDGHEYKYSEKMVKISKSKDCFEWIEIVINRKDRKFPTVIREYFDECYNGYSFDSSPWNTHPKRFLRHKVTIQGARIAFGFAGIYDEDEGERIIQAEAEVVSTEPLSKPETAEDIPFDNVPVSEPLELMPLDIEPPPLAEIVQPAPKKAIEPEQVEDIPDLF